MARPKRLLKAEVKLNGFMLTPNLKITQTKKGNYITRFVIGIPPKQVLKAYPTLKASMKLYSCVYFGKNVKKFVESVQRMDFVKISGTLEHGDFYHVENKYEHIKGMYISCDKVTIATEEYKKYQQKTLEEREERKILKKLSEELKEHEKENRSI